MSNFNCIVCNKLYDGTTHCSVMACRACAMFFKRSNSWLEVPLCKFKDNNCFMSDSRKKLCTSCRFYRCLEVGLIKQENARSLTTMSENAEYSSLKSTNTFKITIDISMLISETMPTLKRFGYNYALSSNYRRKQEMIMLQSDGEILESLPNNEQMCKMTQCRSNRLYDGCITSFQNLIRNSFPAFISLHSNAQEAIILPLMAFYFDLYSSYKTLKTFNNVNTTKLFCSELMYVTLNNVGNFMGQTDSADSMDNQAIMDYFMVIWRNYLNTTLRLMHRIKMTDVEFLAASALIIWDRDNFLQLPHLKVMADSHRQLIYHDLEHYYKNSMHLDNYVERVMNVHELIRTIKKNAVTMTDGVQFLRTFNYYKENAEMYEATQKIVESVDKRSEQTLL